MKGYAPTGCVLALALAAMMAASADWLDAEDLRSYCGAYLEDPDSERGTACVAFVQGFLADGRAPEEPSRSVVESPAAVPGSDESFAERAARTRVGGRLRPPSSAGLRGNYCVGPDVPATLLIREVADYLAVSLGSADAADRPPEALVGEALRRRFPCRE